MSAGRKGAALTIDLMEKRKGSREYLNFDIVVMHIISIELELVVCDAENEKIITWWSRFKSGQIQKEVVWFG